VTLSGNVRKVVLAHSAENARDYYTGMGYRVLSVEAGDYRIDAVTSSTGWRLDRKALAEAVEFLGIECPVNVKQTGFRGGRFGAHQLRGVLRGRFMSGKVSDFARADTVGHYITVKSWLTPEQAGQTLWHELCHAMQAERAMATLPAPSDPSVQYGAWVACSARGNGVAYNLKPVEVEAREYEAFNDERPLAR
jgi:hypothetical protein